MASIWGPPDTEREFTIEGVSLKFVRVTATSGQGLPHIGLVPLEELGPELLLWATGPVGTDRIVLSGICSGSRASRQGDPGSACSWELNPRARPRTGVSCCTVRGRGVGHPPREWLRHLGEASDVVEECFIRSGSSLGTASSRGMPAPTGPLRSRPHGDSPSDMTNPPGEREAPHPAMDRGLVGPGSDPVVADGHVFLTASALPKSKLYGFDASGGSNCTATAPKTCRPQWSVSFPALVGQLVTSLSAPAVNGGSVWIATSAFESPGDIIAGSMNAYSVSTGAPIVSGGQGRAASPAVTAETVYASWSASGPPGTYTGLEAVDAATGASVFTAGPAPYGVGDLPFTAPAVSRGNPLRRLG